MAIFDEVFTAIGSPNIALIKYWCKRDEKLILPQNSSISITLSPDVLHTTTSVMISKKLNEDAFYLDGVRQDLSNKDIRERFEIVNTLRNIAKVREKVLIVSKNDFPTASGLASSASGIATLSYVLNEALELGMSLKELSIIARQGSGSACRSLFGGLVEWHRGTKADGSDSYAEQIFDEKYWPEIIDNIVVVSQAKKKVSSRAGMKQTVDTNTLYPSRPATAEKRVKEMIDAYKKKDFNAVAELTMRDSNEMHALMLSTRPSIRYLNKASHGIMDIIEELNEKEGTNIAAYTFDAGPNAQIITLSKHKSKVMQALRPLEDTGEIIYTKTSTVGAGPRLLGKSDSLIDEKKAAAK